MAPDEVPVLDAELGVAPDSSEAGPDEARVSALDAGLVLALDAELGPDVGPDAGLAAEEEPDAGVAEESAVDRPSGRIHGKCRRCIPEDRPSNLDMDVGTTVDG